MERGEVRALGERIEKGGERAGRVDTVGKRERRERGGERAMYYSDNATHQLIHIS